MHPTRAALRTCLMALCLLAQPLLSEVPMAAPSSSEDREQAADRIVAAAQVDRLTLALAQARFATDPQAEEKLAYRLYDLRPPALWDPQHPAWADARAELIALARGETGDWMKDYWKSYRPLMVREVTDDFTPPELERMLAFAESPGGRAWFERRLARLRAKQGPALFDVDAGITAGQAKAAEARFDALPPEEKRRVEAFTSGERCEACARPPAKVLEDLLERQSVWLEEVLVNHLGSVDWRIADGWKAQLNARLGDRLPVDSKKQILGTLELRADGTLAFTFHFFWKDRADGGTQTLEFSGGHPNRAEVLALAPGLAPGHPRVLYRDAEGVISDRP